MQQQHPRVPWVVYELQPDGSAVVADTRTGRQARVFTEVQLHEFAAEAARCPGCTGAGDAVAAVTRRMGFKKCAPCAQRQATLNRMLPNVWRR